MRRRDGDDSAKPQLKKLDQRRTLGHALRLIGNQNGSFA